MQREIFSVPFSLTSSLSRLWETPSTFLRYGVSHFSFSNTRCLTANEKDPSTSLGMTIRETRLFHFPVIRCFPFLAVKHAPSYHQRKRSLGSASYDDTGNVLFPHILCMMHGIAIPHAVISSVARNLFPPSFPSSFAKSFMGNTVHLSAIRCFPFLFLKHSPSYRQRKRSLGSASYDDTGNVLFSQILCMMHGIAIPHAVISSAARNLFRPLFPSSFAKPFTESTVRLPAIRCFPFLAVKHAPSYRQRKRSLDFARDDDTRNAPFPLSAIRCFPFLAVRRSPSYRQRKRSLDSASDDDTGNVLFPHILCMMHGIAIPHAVISSAARNLFRPLFP